MRLLLISSIFTLSLPGWAGDAEQVALLRKDVAEFNAWREANPKAKIALTRSNFPGASVKQLNLVSADLSGAELKGLDLSDCNLVKANPEGSLWDNKTKWRQGFRPGEGK